MDCNAQIGTTSRCLESDLCVAPPRNIPICRRRRALTSSPIHLAIWYRSRRYSPLDRRSPQDMNVRPTGISPLSTSVERGVNILATGSCASALAWLGVDRIVIEETVASPELGADWLAGSTVDPLVATLLGLLGGLVGSVLPVRSGGARAGRLRALATPLFVPAAAWLFAIPGIGSRLRILGAFHGRFLGWITALAILAVLWEWGNRLAASGRPRALSPKLVRRVVATMAFAIFFCVGWSDHRRVGLSGDEPHYLLISHSLLVDGDSASTRRLRRARLRDLLPRQDWSTPRRRQ